MYGSADVFNAGATDVTANDGDRDDARNADADRKPSAWLCDVGRHLSEVWDPSPSSS